jgi:hypothetical protein
MAARPLVSRRVWLAAGASMAVAFAVVALRTGADAPAPAPVVSAAAAAPGPIADSIPVAAPAPASAGASAALSVAPPATASEEELMDRLRADVDADPRTAVALAEDGERRFPSGRSGDERALLKMRALVHMDQIVVAREAAGRFFEQYPESPYGRLVFKLTGMRPLPPLGPPRR